jgi:hypothetical protein
MGDFVEVLRFGKSEEPRNRKKIEIRQIGSAEKPNIRQEQKNVYSKTEFF